MENKVINLKFYKGSDLYCDGAIEDEILALVQGQTPVLEILKERTDWPILYHLSDMRENLLEWYPFKEHAKTLEIGSGCGAITGILCQKSEKVTCIDLSLKRSQINANKNKKYDNFEILVGNLKILRFQRNMIILHSSAFLNMPPAIFMRKSLSMRCLQR